MNVKELIWSKYNHTFMTADSKYLLYNSSTNLFIELDQSMYSLLIDIKNNCEAIAALNENVLEDLISHKILITKEVENAIYNSKRLRYNLNCYNRNVLSLTLLPTLACNFKCSYCFENDSAATMSNAIVDNVMNFIKSYIPTSSLAITWFGGEPLVGFDKIKAILTSLKKDNIELKQHIIITNGYLLNCDVCDFFRQYPLDHIQITIDGIKPTHDSRRIHKSGTGSYDVIMDNITNALEMLPKTTIGIRINVDASNSNEFANVYNELSKKWTNHSERVSIYPGFVTDFSSQKCSQNECELNRQQRVDFLKKLNKEYNIPVGFFPTHKYYSCAASNVNSFVIGPKGEMYKCWCDVGEETKIVGNIKHNAITNVPLFVNYMAGYTMFDDPQCKDCLLFPVCEGGCRWFRMSRNSDQNYVCSLRKDNLDEILSIHYNNKQISKLIGNPKN